MQKKTTQMLSEKIKKRGKLGFSLVELIVVIAIMAVLVAILVPTILQYVEKSRAQKDFSAMDEVTNAVKIAMADQDVYDEMLQYNVTLDDGGVPTGYAATTNEIAAKWSNDATAGDADAVMRGVTITFKPKADNRKSIVTIGDGIMNAGAPDGKGGKGTLLSAATMDDGAHNYMYGCLTDIVGKTIELNSQTYRNSDYTIFIKMGTLGSGEGVEIYGQWGGTNLPASGEPGGTNKPGSETPEGGDDIEIKSSLDQYSWGEIKAIADGKDSLSKYNIEIGQSKTDENNRTYILVDDARNDAYGGLVFMFNSGISDRMSGTDTNAGGYANATLKTTVDGMITMLPIDLQPLVKDVTIYCNNGISAPHIIYEIKGVKLFLPSVREVGFADAHSNSSQDNLDRALDKESDIVFDYFAGDDAQAKRKNLCSSSPWWLRSAEGNGANYWLVDDSDGTLSINGPGSTRNLAPAFVVGHEHVDEDNNNICDDETCGATINPNVDGGDSVKIKDTLSQYSWAEIKEIANGDEDLATYNIAIGDTITDDKSDITYILVDDARNDAYGGLVFMFNSGTSHKMNSKSTNADGYASAPLKTTVDGMITWLPSDLRTSVKEVTIYCNDGNGAPDTIHEVNGVKMFLPSVREVGFETTGESWYSKYEQYLDLESDIVFDYFADSSTAAANRQTISSSLWWLRSANGYGSNTFWGVKSSGTLGSYSTNYSSYVVAPAFVVGENGGYVSGDNVCQHTNTSTKNAVDANCATSGYSGDIVCDDCGTTVTDGSAIDPTGVHVDADNNNICDDANCKETIDPNLGGGDSVEIKDALSQYSWDDIKKIANGDKALSTYNIAIGDSITDENNRTYILVDDARNDNYGGLVFMFNSGTSAPMNDTATNAGGYDSAAIKTTVDGMITLLPNDLQSLVKEVTIYCNDGNGDPDARHEIKNVKLFLPSVREVGFETTGYSWYSDYEQYLDLESDIVFDCFAGDDAQQRRAAITNSSSYWWLRSAGGGNGRSFWYVNSSGTLYTHVANDSSVVAPAFVVG